jgi:hypothetical protein
MMHYSLLFSFIKKILMRKEIYMQDLTTILNSINAQQSDYPFRPVRCKEADLKDRQPINGFVYFTTDTHKIFCG